MRRKQYSKEFKARVALAALQGDRTLAEIASTYGVHPNLVSRWKQQAADSLPDVFDSGSGGHRRNSAAADEEKARLYEKIGRLEVEIDWLKKKHDLTIGERRFLVEPGIKTISLARQCELLDLPRSTYYFKPAGETEYNELLMRMLDEQYLRTPFFGSRKMTVYLRSNKHLVNHKRVERLMSVMGLRGIHPGPRTSKKCPESRIYPYLLRGLSITRPNHVWCTDITYIRLRTGFVYLIAVMDWATRFVLSQELSNSLDTSFCVRALETALARYGTPEIFNTDQGSQFTSAAFTDVLKERKIKISMDGRGRYLDNIFIERLWRSVKYEEVYLNDYESVYEAAECLKRYFEFYNTERPHQALGYQTPAGLYLRIS